MTSAKLVSDPIQVMPVLAPPLQVCRLVPSALTLHLAAEASPLVQARGKIASPTSITDDPRNASRSWPLVQSTRYVEDAARDYELAR
jgi:hypothetical protein